MTTIALIDDHLIVRSGFAQLLNLEPDFQVVAEFGSGREALAGLPGRGVQVCICDISMPDLSGLELLSQLPKGMATIMLSVHDSPALVEQALNAGARGFLSKRCSPDELIAAVRTVSTGGCYLTPDIANHMFKYERGYTKLINLWGADHHGHVARMKGAMDAIGLNGEDLDVVLMQMVNLMRDGQPVRMSKRTGNAITLTDLLEEVPIDSARFLFNMHDAGSGIDFDLDQAVKTDNDNPVYYVQYAHARICSILKKMESEGVQFAGAEHIDATLLTEPSEMDLIRMLAAFPQEIVMAAEKYDPSRINRFVIDLASAFHRFYGNCRIQGADPAVQQARLALCIGVKNAIFNVLTMFKINVPEKM